MPEQDKLSPEKILEHIDIIERKIKEYEKKIRKTQILDLDCPYEEAISIYEKMAKAFQQLGDSAQAKILFSGAEQYRKKLQKDQKLREIERIKNKDSMDQQVEQILDKIERVEKKIKKYESQLNRFNFLPPYKEAIQIYSDAARDLSRLGWNDQSKRIAEGVSRYQEKLAQDKKSRKKLKFKEKLNKEELSEIEHTAIEAQKKAEQQQNIIHKFKEKERKKEQALNKQAEHILDKIEAVEKKIKEYESNANRFDYPCPYEEAIKVYSESAPKLSRLGWTDQSKRIAEGVIRYQ
ncbi:MAG: hypothetical protein ACTSWC_12445, partial [Promethearchaeota archaeon]